MSCYAQGRCRFCSQKHTLPVFGSRETEHDLIQRANLKLIILNTVCCSCITKLEAQMRNMNCQESFGGSVTKSESNESDDCYGLIPNKEQRKGEFQNLHPADSLIRTQQPCTQMHNEDVGAQSEINTVPCVLGQQIDVPLTKPLTNVLQATACSKDNSLENRAVINASLKRKIRPQMSCDFCEKEFTHTGDFNKHRRKHTGEQPYTCTKCDQRFSHASNLARHQRVHSGERPYLCQQCGRNFARKDKLSHHLTRESCITVKKLKC